MYLTGLTLEALGGDRFAEAPSLVILETRFSSNGMRTWWTDFLNDGPPVILGTAWSGDKSFLSLLPNRVELDVARRNLPVEYVESLSRQGVDIVRLGLGR